MLSATTDLVVLPVTVSNRRGEPVAGLTPQDFVVYDNGVPQKVEFFRQQDTPVTVGLVIDNSSSMQDKRQDVIDAARAFAESSNPLDQIFLVRFNEAVSMALPSGMGFTSSVPVLNAALSTISSRGMTALYDAVAAGLQHLEQGQRARRALIVISDGGDDASRMSKRAALDLAAHSNAVVYTIGLFDDRDQDRNPGVLKDLAHSTGGEAFFPRRTADVVTTCRQIAATIRAGYTLGYVPEGVGTADGRHTVRVEIRRPDAARLKVSTRPGYTSTQGSGSIEIW
ncbi:MAG TPA: VWA domain-containing protein [Vicinamibacterales bacterium]